MLNMHTIEIRKTNVLNGILGGNGIPGVNDIINKSNTQISFRQMTLGKTQIMSNIKTKWRHVYRRVAIV